MAAEAKSNTYDMEQIESFMDRMQSEEDAVASIMGKAMKDCQGPRGNQKEIKDEAKQIGIRPKVFNAIWAQRKALNAAEAKITDLEDDDREQIEEILRHANSDKAFKNTPMGAHLNAVLGGE